MIEHKSVKVIRNLSKSRKYFFMVKLLDIELVMCNFDGYLE